MILVKSGIDSATRAATLKKIERQIRALEARKRELLVRENPVASDLRKSVLRPTDTVTRKNRHKFDVLGRIRYALDRHPNGSAGLTSAQIFELVKVGASDLKFETLRSYMSRFKREGRLLHEAETGLWRFAAHNGGAPKNN